MMLAAATHTASAQYLRLRQEFRRFLLFDVSGEKVNVVVIVDTSGMTGVGTETFVADQMSVVHTQANTGLLNGLSAFLPVPKNDTGGVAVTFTNGGNPQLSAIQGFTLLGYASLNSIQGVCQFGFNQRPSMQFGGSVIFTNRYDLHGPATTVEDLGRPPCSSADITTPRGLVSHRDVRQFVDWFSEGNFFASNFAEPYGTVSQADVDAFVTRFFEGCAPEPAELP
ncbi:MAG: hypothetical protein AAFQ71_00870 [Planctomycetota bacterium]